jgi:hypothetical protein
VQLVTDEVDREVRVEELCIVIVVNAECVDLANEIVGETKELLLGRDVDETVVDPT